MSASLILQSREERESELLLLRGATQLEFLKGFFFACLTAGCAVGMSVSSKLAGEEGITPYTSNLITSVVGTALTAATILLQRKSFVGDFPGWKSLFAAYGLALWCFMWGTFKALQLMDLASYQSMNACFNQVLVMIIAAALLGELVDTFKVFVLSRNAMAIALIIKPPFLFGGDASVPLLGVLFLFVQCTGSAVGAVFQRRLSDQPVEPLLFWGFFANVIYWLPPGVSSLVRIPILWDSTSDQISELTLGSVIFPSLSGMFEGSWYIFCGYGMKYMTAANFFFIMIPLALAMSCSASVLLFHETLDEYTLVAFIVIAVGFVIDRCWETRTKFQSVAALHSSDARDVDFGIDLRQNNGPEAG